MFYPFDKRLRNYTTYFFSIDYSTVIFFLGKCYFILPADLQDAKFQYVQVIFFLTKCQQLNVSTGRSTV